MKHDKTHNPELYDKSLSGWDRFCLGSLHWGILGLIIFSPLPAASVNEWSILTIQLSVLLLTILYVSMRKKPEINLVLARVLRKTRWMIAAFFGYLIFQVVPLPSALIRFISPRTAAYHIQFSLDGAQKKYMALSLVPGHTLERGLELLSYILLAFLILKTITTRKQIMRIFTVLLGMGLFESVFGLIQLASIKPSILFYPKVYALDSVSGTFVNRNHFAGYMEMIIPLAVGYIIARSGWFSRTGIRWRERLLMLSEKNTASGLLLSMGVVVMSLGLILSRSRSGVFLLAFSFILLFGLAMLNSGGEGRQSPGIRIFFRSLFIFIAGLALVVGIGATLERFSMDRILQEARPAFWSNTLKIVGEYPVFGTGLGTFGSIYPEGESAGTPMSLAHAHNDYLEYTAELGLVGIALLLGAILYLIAACFRVWKSRRLHESVGLGLGGLVAVLCILIHSLTDFNLHIPANMLLFALTLSLTAVAVFHRKRDDSDHLGRREQGKEAALR